MTWRNIILSLALALPVSAAFAHDEVREPQLVDMILTGDQLFNLSLEQKVAYQKFMLNFMVVLEDIQDIPSESKHAQIERLMQYLIAEANAATGSFEGTACVNAFNEGQWTVSQRTGHLWCKPAESIDCGGGKVICGQALQDQVPGLGKVCVKDPGPNAHPGRTAMCTDALAAAAGVTLDARLQAKAESYRDPAQAKAYNDKAAQLRKALQPFSTKIAQTCRPGVQTEECGKVSQIRDAFETTTTLKQDPYKKGLTYAPTADQQKKLATVRTARQDAQGVIAQPINDEGSQTPVKKSNTRAVAADPLKEFPPAPSPASASKAVKEKPGKQQNGNCESRYHAQLGALACVACGMEKAAGADIRQGKGVGNWISLLGVSAQSFYGPYNTQDENSRAAYQQRVMEMVASYGYCTDTQYPINTDSVASRDWIDGSKAAPRPPSLFHWGGGADAKAFANAYGIGGADGTGSMAFASDLFDDSSRWTGWDEGNVQQRQWRFRSRLAAHASTYAGSKFAGCASNLEDRLKNSTPFKMCPIRKGASKGAPVPDYQPVITDQEMSNNQAFYASMAKECGVKAERKFKNNRCDNICWGSRVYPTTNAQLHNCDHDGIESGKQFERKKPRGKPGEPSQARSNYGGNHDGSLGNGFGDSGDHGGHDGGSSGGGHGGGGGGSSGGNSGGGSGGGGGGGGGKGGEGGGAAR